MNRLLVMSLSIIFLASQRLPADANERGNGAHTTAPAQQRVPIQQTPRQPFQPASQQQAQRETFQRPPNATNAPPSTVYAPAQGNTSFQAHPSVPQAMFRNQVNVAPTYRTAPAFRSSQPTSWTTRSKQIRQDNTGGDRHNVSWDARFQQRDTFHAGASFNAEHDGRHDGGRYVAWHERFNHGSDNGYWHHNRGGGAWNNTTNYYNDTAGSNSSGGGNLTVPILAVAAALTLDAFHSHGSSCSCDSASSTTIINNAPVPAPDPTPYAYHSNPDYYAHDAASVQPDAPAQVAVAGSNDTHAPYLADSDLLAYDDGPVVVHDGDAPADEYFGSTHMSVLGIRNSINDTNRRAIGAGEETGHGLLHMLLFTEQAFHDWQRKYPHDTWIITNGYELVDDFAKLDAETPNENPHVAAIHGIDLGNWLDATYPGNPYASK